MIMNDQLLVHVKKLPNMGELPLPFYATVDSAGMDLMAAIDEDMIIKPFERVLVPTGIALELPKGFEAQVRPRSGMALKHGITIPNAPGTIDADYRGEVGVILLNLGKEDFKINRGMKIAQLVIARYTRVEWSIAENLNTTERSAGGFGSTGAQTKIASNSNS